MRDWEGDIKVNKTKKASKETKLNFLNELVEIVKFEQFANEYRDGDLFYMIHRGVIVKEDEGMKYSTKKDVIKDLSQYQFSDGILYEIPSENETKKGKDYKVADACCLYFLAKCDEAVHSFDGYTFYRCTGCENHCILCKEIKKCVNHMNKETKLKKMEEVE